MRIVVEINTEVAQQHMDARYTFVLNLIDDGVGRDMNAFGRVVLLRDIFQFIDCNKYVF